MFEMFFVEINGKKLELWNDLLICFFGMFGLKIGFVCFFGCNFVGLVVCDGCCVMVVILGVIMDLECL